MDSMDPRPEPDPATPATPPTAPDPGPYPASYSVPPEPLVPPPGPGFAAPMSYSPPPEAPTEWQRQTRGAPPARRGSSLGMVFLTAILAAVLASSGTYAAIRASGGLDRPAATVISSSSAGTNVTQPVTVDEQSATISAAAKVGPAVVR